MKPLNQRPRRMSSTRSLGGSHRVGRTGCDSGEIVENVPQMMLHLSWNLMIRFLSKKCNQSHPTWTTWIRRCCRWRPPFFTLTGGANSPLLSVLRLLAKPVKAGARGCLALRNTWLLSKLWTETWWTVLGFLICIVFLMCVICPNRAGKSCCLGFKIG